MVRWGRSGQPAAKRRDLASRDRHEQVFRGRHRSEFNGALVAKGLVAPFADRTDLLDSGDTVVGDEDLTEGKKVSKGGRWENI